MFLSNDTSVFVDLFLVLSSGICGLFLFQALIGVFYYKQHNLRSARDHISLCFSSGIYACSTFISIVYPTLYALNFASLLAMISANLSSFFYLRLMSDYLEIKSAAVRFISYMILSFAIFFIAVFFEFLATGDQTFFSMAVLNTENLLWVKLNKYGMEPRLGTIVFLALHILGILFSSTVFLIKIIKNRQSEYILGVGIVSNLIFVINDSFFVLYHLKYMIPLMFLSYFFEIIRFSFVFQKKAFEKLNDLEEQLIEIGKIAEVGFMVGNITHDIRNPLSTIIGSVQYLAHKVSLPEKGLSKVQMIERSAKRISKIIDTYLTFLEKENEGSGESGSESLSKIVSSALDLCHAKIDSIGLQNIILNIEDSIHIKGVENHLVMAFTNLVSNSCDAISQLSEKWIKINATESDGVVNLQFMDSGSGIPADVAKNIFERQFTTKSSGKGTGLGLDFVKRVFEKHRGCIELDASAQNTCFKITFPVK